MDRLVLDTWNFIGCPNPKPDISNWKSQKKQEALDDMLLYCTLCLGEVRHGVRFLASVAFFAFLGLGMDRPALTRNRDAAARWCRARSRGVSDSSIFTTRSPSAARFSARKS